MQGLAISCRGQTLRLYSQIQPWWAKTYHFKMSQVVMCDGSVNSQPQKLISNLFRWPSVKWSRTISLINIRLLYQVHSSQEGCNCVCVVNLLLLRMLYSFIILFCFTLHSFFLSWKQARSTFNLTHYAKCFQFALFGSLTCGQKYSSSKSQSDNTICERHINPPATNAVTSSPYLSDRGDADCSGCRRTHASL